MKTEAVMESADFGPAYEGESFVLVTLRVPRDTRVGPGAEDPEGLSERDCKIIVASAIFGASPFLLGLITGALVFTGQQ